MEGDSEIVSSDNEGELEEDIVAVGDNNNARGCCDKAWS